jgi:FtsH-binding integral membrane protein
MSGSSIGARTLLKREAGMLNEREYVQGAVWEAGVSARAEFIKKTYFHLLAAIVAFVGIEAVLFQTGAAEVIAAAMLGTSWLLVLGAFMLVSWGASRVAFSAISLPAQYAALAAYVVAEAVVFVPLLYLAAHIAPDVIGHAALMTLLGFTGLTALVFLTRRDFSFLRALLMWGFIAALLAIVGGVVFGFNLGLWFSVGMVLFAGAAILYDTSNVLHHFPEDRYVGAAMQLFASVALLFWYVLRIFMSARD